MLQIDVFELSGSKANQFLQHEMSQQAFKIRFI